MVELKNKQLKQWSRKLSQHLGHLSLPQLGGLATWSFGMVMTRSSSVDKISEFIATLNGEKSNTVRQRLKEWYQEKQTKKGEKRAELEVNTCFSPLLKWILSLWPDDNLYLPLGMDATNIGNKLTVLSVNVLIRGSGIPVGWKIVKATEKGAWQSYWKELFELLKCGIPPKFTTIVCADRGLYADWLYHQIVDCGWHPMLRINHRQGTVRTSDSDEWQPLSKVIPTPDVSCFAQKVTCFKTNPIDCTLLAGWQSEYKEPWAIITDLEPQSADIVWYKLRYWIECSYRDFKSDGWQWHKTRLTEPKRAERVWLAMAVATLWTISVGGAVDSQCIDFSSTSLRRSSRATSPNQPTRHLSCFLIGLITILANLLNAQPVILPDLLPEPWPSSFSNAIHDTS